MGQWNNHCRARDDMAERNNIFKRTGVFLLPTSQAAAATAFGTRDLTQRSPSPATATAIEAATERSLSPLRAAAIEAAVQRSLSPAPAAAPGARGGSSSR